MVPGVADRLVEVSSEAKVDLLPGGQVLRTGCQVPFPKPTEISAEPRIISLSGLVSLKLDSCRVSPLLRAKDKADFVELILARQLPRDFPVAAAVRDSYEFVWDGLRAELTKRETTSPAPSNSP